MKPYEQKLIALRQEMDMIDDNIIGALSGRIDCVGEQYSPIFVYEQQRLSICKKIAQIKKEYNLEIFDEKREKEVLEKYGFYIKYAQTLLKKSRKVQLKFTNEK